MRRRRGDEEGHALRAEGQDRGGVDRARDRAVLRAADAGDDRLKDAAVARDDVRGALQPPTVRLEVLVPAGADAGREAGEGDAAAAVRAPLQLARRRDGAELVLCCRSSVSPPRAPPSASSNSHKEELLLPVKPNAKVQYRRAVSSASICAISALLKLLILSSFCRRYRHHVRYQ